MRNHIAVGLLAVSTGLLVLTGAADPAVAQDKSKSTPPKHLYGHDLRVRKGGSPDFGKDTPRIGVEFFHDAATDSLIVISETGSLAVAKAPASLGADRKCEWKTAHDLHCRKAGEAEFTKTTKKWGVEMFQDRGTNELLYVCESASVALAPVPAGLVTNRGPKLHHGMEARVRAPEQDKFDSAKKIGIEAFKDENTGYLMYITETGAVAVVPNDSPTPEAKKVQPPKTQYGLVLRVRGADEANFSDKTKQIGLEVFEDPNAGTLFYITESGSIAVVPAPGKFVADAKGVTWKAAMSLRARKGGEADFKTAKQFGVEVFVDNRTGNLIFISDTGSVAVLPKK